MAQIPYHASLVEDPGFRTMTSAVKVGLAALGYGSESSVRSAISKGTFPVPVYKRLAIGPSPLLVFTDEVAEYQSSLSPLSAA